MVKLNPDGTALFYSTYLGGSDFELAGVVAVDPHGNAYHVGITFSTDFPTLNPFQAANAGADDTFVTKFNAAGNALVYSTYLGGSGFDEAGGIALDSKGNVYIEGVTTSTDFPVLNAFQSSFAGGFSDAFMTKISPGKGVLLTRTGQAGSAATQQQSSSRLGKARRSRAAWSSAHRRCRKRAVR